MVSKSAIGGLFGGFAQGFQTGAGIAARKKQRELDEEHRKKQQELQEQQLNLAQSTALISGLDRIGKLSPALIKSTMPDFLSRVGIDPKSEEGKALINSTIAGKGDPESAAQLQELVKALEVPGLGKMFTERSLQDMLRKEGFAITSGKILDQAAKLRQLRSTPTGEQAQTKITQDLEAGDLAVKGARGDIARRPTVGQAGRKTEADIALAEANARKAQAAASKGEAELAGAGQPAPKINALVTRIDALNREREAATGRKERAAGDIQTAQLFRQLAQEYSQQGDNERADNALNQAKALEDTAAVDTQQAVDAIQEQAEAKENARLRQKVPAAHAKLLGMERGITVGGAEEQGRTIPTDPIILRQLGEAKRTAERMNADMGAIIERLGKDPRSSTALGSLARFSTDILADFEAFMPGAFRDVATIQKSPLVTQAFAELGQMSEQVRSTTEALAFTAAGLIANQEGRSISDRDAAVWVRIVGQGISNPETRVAGLRNVARMVDQAVQGSFEVFTGGRTNIKNSPFPNIPPEEMGAATIQELIDSRAFVLMPPETRAAVRKRAGALEAVR